MLSRSDHQNRVKPTQLTSLNCIHLVLCSFSKFCRILAARMLCFVKEAVSMLRFLKDMK